MTPPEECTEKVILIDPGHGGLDGGAVTNKGFAEKHINLSICKKLRDKLNEYGYVVIMSRDSDNGLYTKGKSVSKMKYEDLNNRCLIKRDSNCDIFISIHQNHFPESKYHGAQVWYSNSEKSKILGETIQKNLRNDLDKSNKREAKKAVRDYKILRCFLHIPSVIVECGFLSNSAEAERLLDSAYQDLIVDSLLRSVNEYFENEIAAEDD